MILVTGGTGLLGSEIKKQLGTQPALYPSRSELDITNFESIKSYVAQKSITAIINCAANVNAEFLEENEEYAQIIGVDAPRFLAKISAEIDVPLIHISTDYVFDGTKNTPYREDDAPNGISVYGKTKAAGEQEVLKYATTCAIIRTAWLFSENGRDFISTIRRISKERSEISVVYDQIGSPTYIPDLAEIILKVSSKLPYGKKEIYHATNEGVCTWYDLAQLVVSGLGINCKVKPIRSHEFPLKAKRPHYSVLDKAKIKTAYKIEIRHFTEALQICLNNVKN